MAFTKESDLVAAFCDQFERRISLRKQPWIIYPETGGFDLLLVHKENGTQIGLEAKLSLNAKVLSQAIPSYDMDGTGPDYRGVLVPVDKIQAHMSVLAERLGVGVVSVVSMIGGYRGLRLPDEDCDYREPEWFPWLPMRRCSLPAYIPDVVGGKPSPICLTLWKVKAIKLMILLDKKGAVTRRDMKFLGISPTAWTQRAGYLSPGEGAYVRHDKTPDFKKQHPINYAEIEADYERWVFPPHNVKTLTTP